MCSRSMSQRRATIAEVLRSGPVFRYAWRMSASRSGRARTLALTAFLGAAVVAPAVRTACAADDAEPGPARHRLEAAQLGIVVNDEDPLSARIAEYYRERRGIPAENTIHLRFPAGDRTLAREKFEPLHDAVQAQAPRQVQALVLTWTKPYRVDCMSVTAAFAFGFDPALCAKGCQATQPSPYFNSRSWAPFRHYGMRPAMMLAGGSFEEMKRLIDRGVAADGTHPAGTGYLVETADRQRSVRAPIFPELARVAGHRFRLEHVKAEFIEDRTDVMFYFTGLTKVAKIEDNTYLPGAIADHLTSTGGVLDGSDQMSSLAWLKAGATGSYGTVVEPCNFPGKFPNPAIAIGHYLAGETLIEAYWKSVEMPGQGVFVGEPLARPFGPPE